MSNLNYPPAAVQANIVGRVYLGFVVKAEGSVGEITVIESPDPLLAGGSIPYHEPITRMDTGNQGWGSHRRNLTLPVDFKLQTTRHRYLRL